MLLSFLLDFFFYLYLALFYFSFSSSNFSTPSYFSKLLFYFINYFNRFFSVNGKEQCEHFAKFLLFLWFTEEKNIVWICIS